MDYAQLRTLAPITQAIYRPNVDDMERRASNAAASVDMNLKTSMILPFMMQVAYLHAVDFPRAFSEACKVLAVDETETRAALALQDENVEDWDAWRKVVARITSMENMPE